MNDKIKICYTIRDNLGDSINPLIIKNCFSMEPICVNEYYCDISGIGSGLRRFFVKKEALRNRKFNLIEKVVGLKPLIIWSAGFLTTPTDDEICIRKNIKIASVRGELSKMHIERITKKEVNCSTGDAGLLASSLLNDKKIEKRYSMGIIPHDKERFEEKYCEISRKVQDSIIIDVRGNALQRIETIAACETIISSSLHGLIIADGFSIPNLHVKLTDKLSGDGFKFRDYYSSFGLDDEVWDLNKSDSITPSIIKSGYSISKEQVEKKKVDIKEAFYKYL